MTAAGREDVWAAVRVSVPSAHLLAADSYRQTNTIDPQASPIRESRDADMIQVANADRLPLPPLTPEQLTGLYLDQRLTTRQIANQLSGSEAWVLTAMETLYLTGAVADYEDLLSRWVHTRRASDAYYLKRVDQVDTAARKEIAGRSYRAAAVAS